MGLPGQAGLEPLTTRVVMCRTQKHGSSTLRNDEHGNNCAEHWMIARGRGRAQLAVRLTATRIPIFALEEQKNRIGIEILVEQAAVLSLRLASDLDEKLLQPFSTASKFKLLSLPSRAEETNKQMLHPGRRAKA
jgi:hypothetical protein